MNDPEVEWTGRDGYMLTAEASLVDIASHTGCFRLTGGVQVTEGKLGTPCPRRRKRKGFTIKNYLITVRKGC